MQVQRKCFVTNQVLNVELLTRISFNKKNNSISLDLEKKQKGRGAYFISSQENWELIKKNKMLNRVFRFAVPKSVYEAIENQLKEQVWTKKQE